MTPDADHSPVRNDAPSGLDEREVDLVLDTRYRVPGNELVEEGRFHVGDDPETVARWLSHADVSSATLLTACNPEGRLASKEDNQAAMEQLQDSLGVAGLRFVPAVAEGPEDSWTERGCCVFDASMEQVEQLLLRFRQRAAVRAERGKPVWAIWNPELA
jgi:hypothetical protein